MSVELGSGALMLLFRSAALAGPPLDPLDGIPNEPVVGWAASPRWTTWQRHSGGLSGDAARVVSYVTLHGLGQVKPAAGGGDHGAGPTGEHASPAVAARGEDQGLRGS